MSERTQAWPPRWRYRPSRVYAALLDGQIVTEDGDWCPARDWREISDALFARNLILFTPPLSQQPWLREAIADPRAECAANVDGHPISLRVTRGRHARRVIPAASWTDDIPLADLPAAVRDACDTAGLGDHATPSALGQALMADTWPAERTRLYRPYSAAWRALHETTLGGRADLFDRSRHAMLYEVDRNASYPASSMWVPAGTAMPTSRLDGATGYYRCAWTATGNSLLPLGVRQPDNRLLWPADGSHLGWYWAEEIRAARERGAKVVIQYGFCWPGLAPVLREWAYRCWELRGQVAQPGLLKKASVTAIGRFLMERTSRTLTLEQIGRNVCDPETGTSPYFIHERFRERADALSHVGGYILMQARLALLYRMEEEQRQRLVASNYDAVYTTNPPKKAEDTLGGWKWAQLTNARIPVLRHLESDQKRRTPGISSLSGG